MSIAPLLTRTANLRRLDDALGGADTFELFLAEVARTEDILKSTTHSYRTHRALLTLLAEQAQLAGWAAFDAGWLDRSAVPYMRSQDAAREAGDPALVANALALHAYQKAFNGQPDPGMAEVSRQALSRRVPPRVRALVHDRASWTFALANMPSRAQLSLDQAAEALSANEGSPDPDWSAWVDETELDIMTGRCWSALRRPLRAVEPLERALAHFRTRSDETRPSIRLRWPTPTSSLANSISAPI